MEMNTRIQVEHPVTEDITGLDLVEWQLLAAAGQTLPKTQKDIQACGHAIEVRLYAEDTDQGFLPQTGTLRHLSFAQGEDIRIETGVTEGDDISSHYDPMIAKIIAKGPTREQALGTLKQALQNTHVAGVTTNLAYLRRAVGHVDFAKAKLTTKFLDIHQKDMAPASHPDIYPLAAACVLANRKQHATLDPWGNANLFRLNSFATETLRFKTASDPEALTLTHTSPNTFKAGKKEVKFKGTGNELNVTIDEKSYLITAHYISDDIWLDDGLNTIVITPHNPTLEAEQAEVDIGSLTAPTTGMVVKISAKDGQSVAEGAELVIMEAMKTEYRITAPVQGTVEKVLCTKGDHVEKDAILIQFTPQEDASA